jgi:pilus assembly protein Flp/PilA
MIKSIKVSAVRHLTALRNERTAAGALEYALLASFIAVAVIAGATSFGTALNTFFTTMGTVVAAWKT